MKRLSRRTSKTLASVMAVLMMLSSMTTPVLAATEAAEQETEQSTAAAVSWDEKIAELQTKAEEIDPAAENAAEKIEEIRGQLAVITASVTLEYESGLIGDEAYTAYEDSVAALEAYLDSILEEPDEEEEPVPDEDSGEEDPSAYNVQSVLEEIAALQSAFEAIDAEAENAESQYTEINDQLTLIISASVQAHEEEKITQEEYAQINEAASVLQTSAENVLTPAEETPAPAEELPAYDVQAALDAIAALQAEAEALDPEDETIADLCADLYDEAMEVYDEAFAAFEADEITEEQYLEVENGAAALFAYLKSEYGYDPYAIAMYAPPGGDWSPGGSTSTGTAKKDGQSETFNSNHYYHIDILVEGNYDYNFTYTSAASNQAELVLSKAWEGDDASTRPDEVNVTVLRNTEGSAAAYYTTVTLTAAGGWTDTISVPIADDNDEPYIYSLTDSVIGYASTSTTATFTLSDASYTTYTDAVYGSIDFYHDSTAPKIVIRQADGTTTTLEDWSGSGDTSTASVTVDSLTGTWSYDHTDGTYSYSTEETMTVESIDYVTYTNIDGQRTILYADSSARTIADLDANGNGTLDDFPVTEQKEGSTYYRPDPDYFLYYEQDDTNRDEFTQEFWSSNRAIRDMGTSPVIAVGYDYTYTVLNEFGVVEEKLSSTSQTVNTASTSYSNYCGNANTRGTQRGFDVILKNTDLNSASDEYSASDEVVLTNTYDNLTSVTVSKTWVHNDNPNPPESLVIYLLADGVRVDSYTLTGPDWSHTFTNLPKFNASGRAIVYTMEEELVPNYAITGNEPLHLTNTYDPALTSVKVNKVWADTGVPHPESVAVTLYANGHALTSTVLSESNHWSHEFTNLLVVDDEGNAIEYTVQETTPAGYEATITGDAANGFEITNALMPVEVPVTKIWNDNGDRYGIRPESITVKLLANGNEKDTAVLNAGNSWSHTFTDLPAADSNGSISYTVQEVAVPGYDTTIDGYTITNTLITTSVTGVKIWNDESNRDGIRPDSITLKLYADGVATGRTLVVSDVNNTDADSWNYRFDGLPKYNQNNEEIKYTVVEEPVANYTTTYSTDGLTVTNTYVPQKTSITAKKIWVGIPASVDQPFSVTVALYGNNTLIEKDVVLSASNNWTYSWTNLSLNEGGIPISYRVYETNINYTDGSVAPANSQFEVTYKYDEQAENTITNTYSPETTSLTVAKRWDDDSNAEGFRPEGVTIGLYGNGELVTLADGTSNPIVLNEGKYWAHTFTHLPINDEFNNPITYEIFELENGQPIADGGTLAQGTGTADDYTVSYGTTDDGHLTITNSNTIEYVRIVGEKVWDDANDFDGLRPDEVIIKLYADGELYNHVHITEKENWVYLFDNLPKYKDGQEVVYTVTETIDGVELKQGDEIDVNGDKVMDYVVTSLGLNRIVNTHTVEYVNITGGKIWNDDYDRDGYRPNSITLELYKTVDGTKELVDTATATSSGNWQFAFNHLPKYEDGVEIEYSVEERAVAGYKSVVTVTRFEGDQYYVITNTHIPDTTSITVKKTWVDGESSSRPSNITLILYADNAKYREVTITADDNWSYTFTNLPKNAAGKVNTPIVYTVKEAAVSGYSVVYDGFNITNIQTTSVSGSKIWKDADDQDGKRPASITVNLFADGSRIASDEITAADDWKYTFSDLPKYDAETGKLIAYTVTEDEVSDYSISINGYNITNTHTPELITIRGEKRWADNSNQDGVRPSTITLNLLADGVVVRTMTLTDAEGSEENVWPFQFENLPKYKDGVEIKYTVTENTVANYDASYSEDTLTITNTHEPAVTSLTVKKAWNDNENQDNTRPDKITVTLYKSSARRTMEKVTVDADGNPIQNPVAIKAESGWEYTFTNLPKFANGVEIVYHAEESVDGLGSYVAHYQNNGDGTFTITNTRAEKTTITVQKKWNDAENQDGARPSEVVVALYKNGVQDGDPITLNEANSWYGEWEDKAVFDDKGKRIEYHVKELDAQGNPIAEGGRIGNYIVSYEEGAMSADHVIVNSYTPQLITIEGEKFWDDDNNRDGLRPKSIKVTLLADGSEIAHLHPSAETNWKYTFHNLPKYKDQGTEIVYTIAEDAISGYTTTINGCDITNTHIPATTSIEVKKFWNDNSDQDGVRPESITVKLLADGAVVKTVKLDATNASGTNENEWSYTFEGLSKYQNGKEIVYTVAEDIVDGYDTIVSGYNITNTHIPETITIEGEKLWDDNNDQDGIRPVSITIQLLADGTVVRTVHVTGANGSDASKWSYTFEDLPKYQNGREISYTVKEPAAPGYTATISGYTVTNTHKPEVVDITANKIWADGNDIASLRPESVTFTLFADGVKYGDAVTLNEQNQWSYTWNDLAKYSSGKEIVYTVREEEVEHYITGIPNGVNITNTLKKTEIEIRKIWDDDDDQKGKRPSSITVELLRGSKVEDTITLTEQDGWVKSFVWYGEIDDLSVREINVPSCYYAVESQLILDTDGYCFTITNVYVEEEKEDPEDEDEDESEDVTVKKVWVGGDKSDRPAVKIRLYKDGKAYRTITLSDGKWRHVWEEISDDEDIEWSVEELDVPDGYVSSIRQVSDTYFIVTNTWDEEENRYTGA